MKKLLSMLLALVMVMSLAACSNTTEDAGNESGQPGDITPNEPAADGSGEEPAEITVTGQDSAGEEIQVTVPYKPQRVVVLDLANLDILDNLGLGNRIVGVPSITLEYLQSYAEDDSISNVGTVKTPDLEAVMACEPDLIFMGGRMAEYYDSLSEIAPVLRLTTATGAGLIESIRANAKTIGSIFGEGEQVDELLAQYDARIAALAEVAEGHTCLLGMCTTGSFNLLGNDGRCSIIVNEIGFDNIGVDAATTGSSGRGSSDGSESDSSGSTTPTHGNEASFELIVELNPDYIFVMDRDAAIGTSGAQLAQEVMENELVMKTDAYQNGHLVILANPGIWYLAEGGITSLGVMLEDLEAALLG